MSKNKSNGATGVGPASQSESQLTVKTGPVSRVNGHTPMNGHLRRTGESTKTDRTEISHKEESSRHSPHMNGASANGCKLKILRMPETSIIIRKLYHQLLSVSGVEAEVTKELEIPESVLKKQSKSRLICRIVELTTEYILTSEHSLESFIKELRKMKFEVQLTTMYSEFRQVATDLFSDEINFGRVLSFLRFSVAYAVFLYRKGMKKMVPSIEAWTVEVIEEDLGGFFKENKGWEGFAEYMETLHRAEQKNRHLSPQEPRSMWDTMYAFGAVAAGVAAAYGLKQVFS